LQATIAKLGAIFSDSQVDDLHRAFLQKKGPRKYTLNTLLRASMMMTSNKLTAMQLHGLISSDLK
jgi:hypothetical protein